jgi:hypothetical protein
MMMTLSIQQEQQHYSVSALWTFISHLSRARHKNPWNMKFLFHLIGLIFPSSSSSSSFSSHPPEEV